jgi:gliding motility-associated-like protein
MKIQVRFAISVFLFSGITVNSNAVLAQGCPGLSSVTLNVTAAPEPEIDGPAEFCPGSSATLTVTQTYNTYNWSNGGNTQSVTVNAPGTYRVTVTNAAGCTGTDLITVSAAPVPTPSITAAPYACNGQLVLSAGAGFTTYDWSNGDTINPITVTSSGSYSVTVSNAAGCNGVAAFNANIPNPPSVTVSGNTEFCSNGSTTLSATAGLSAYNWSNGQNGQTITVSAGGTYTVTATDSFGCTTTATATVTTLPAPQPDIAGPNAVCTGESATFTVPGAFNTYAWSNGQSGQSITVNTAGTYAVTVTDANNCTGTASESLSLLPLPQPAISAAPYQCDGQLTLNAGAGFANYVWSNGQGNNPITINSAGTYDVTVTDAQGCTNSAAFNAVIPADPTVQITGDNQFCSNESANLQATAGFNSYAWSNGQNAQNIQVFNPGNYTVTVTDGFGCTAADNFTVGVLPAPLPAVSGPGAVCTGQQALLEALPGFNNYAWSNGQNGQSISVNAAGTYTVTVTDANNCTGTASESLSLLPLPLPAISAAPYACDGQLTLNAGPGFSNYAWSNGQSNNPASVNISGSYSVTVTGSNGCTNAAAFFAVIPADPQVSISGANQFCVGNSATLQATPGLAAYIWSNGQNGASIVVNTAGTYTVTATDNLGCTASADFILAQLPAPTPVVSGPAVVCAGQAATLQTQGGFNAYAWSNGQFTPAVNVSVQGTYSVTVTDANGCTGEDAQNLNVLPTPQPDISAAPYACNGQLTLNAGAGFSVYAWSNGQNGPSISVAQSGDYTVTVTGANGCTGTDLFFADIPADPQVQISGNNTFCQGGNAALTASAGLIAYLWSTGETTQSISVNQTGNYEVTATNAFGCTATGIFPVQALNNPVPVIAGPATICVGSQATFTVPGAFSAYNWSSGQNTQSITISDPGTYIVTVTAANGCTGTDTQTLALSTSLEPEIAPQPYNCDGQIALDAGAGFASYNWSNGATTQSVSVNTPGDYTVTVSDATGCSGTDVVAVTIPSDPVVDISGLAAICQNASATLNASAGFNAYIWSNGQVGPAITVNTAGNYTVTATDNFGCTATDVFTLNVNPLPNASVSGPSLICTNGSAVLNAPAGLSAYLWSTAETGPAISVSAAGTYSVTITDANGCTNTAAASVGVAAPPAPQPGSLPYACNAQITLDAGPGFSAYAWSNGQNTRVAAAALSGDYTVTVTDANGCTGTATLAVTIPSPPVVDISGSPAVCQGNTADLIATPGYNSYSWSNGQTASVISAGLAGSYAVTVTDNLGCTATDVFNFTVFPPPNAAVSGPSVICVNSSGVLSAPPGLSAYLWSNGETTPAIAVNTAGIYQLTVTDANGCTNTGSATLSVATQLDPQIAPEPYTCDGQIQLDAGAGFSTYIWNNGQTGAVISAQTSGTYTVTVTDATGCTGVDAIQINVPALPVATISGDVEFCAGAQTTLTATAGFQSYAWSTGEVSPAINTSLSGPVTLTVTDALGCTATAAIQLSALPPPAPVVSGPQAFCAGASATLSVSGAFTAIQWSTGASGASISVNTAGSYSLTVTDVAGCTGVATANLALLPNPAPQITLLPYTCDGQIGLSAGPGFTAYLWNNGGATSGISVSQSGVYSVQVTDQNGCTGTAAVPVGVPALPQVSITGDDRLCPGAAGALQASAGFVQYAWSTGAGTPGIAVNQAGLYQVTATDAQGCTATASFSVQGLQSPQVQISGPAVLCGGSATLSGGSGFTAYQWSNGQTNPQITVTQPGSYGLTVTDANGCTGTALRALAPGTADTTFLQAQSCDPQQIGVTVQRLTGSDGCDSVVVTQTLAGGLLTVSIAVDSDYKGFGVSCAGAVDGVATSQPQSGQAPFQYLWSTGATAATIVNAGAGSYTVTVTDAAGCTGTATAALTQPAPVLPVVRAIGPTCFSPGAVTVQSVSGGLAPYTVRLFQEVGVTNGTQVLNFDNLQEGVFTVEVTDANGCTAEEVVVLAPLEVVNELVGDTLEILPGETVTLNAPITIEPVEIVWTAPGVDLSCDDCLNPTLSPVRTTQLRLFVQGFGACTAEGVFLIKVKTGGQVYIPNTFAPGTDGLNDRFTIYGDERVLNIRSLQVYDRWGGQMAIFQNILPNRPELGWDGSFRGKPMPPGVYAYWAEIEFADGRTEVFSGDVTVVR